MNVRPAIALPVLLCATLGSCHAFLFSSIRHPDRSRPVALIEVRGKEARLGAATSEGIVFLNDDGAEGACRVHYFLGGDLLVEAGVIRKLGGIYHLAEIDLKTQAVSVMTRELTPEDELVALTLVGDDVETTSVYLATDPAIKGYALQWPGEEIPSGTGIFRYRTGRQAGDLQFVGLANGLATLTVNGEKRRYITFTGPARMREALATPKPSFREREVKHRPDGITITR